MCARSSVCFFCMSICVCVYEYCLTIYAFVRLPVCPSLGCLFISFCAYVYVRLSVPLYVHVFVCMCPYLCMPVFVHVCLCVVSLSVWVACVCDIRDAREKRACDRPFLVNNQIKRNVIKSRQETKRILFSLEAQLTNRQSSSHSHNISPHLQLC